MPQQVCLGAVLDIITHKHWTTLYVHRDAICPLDHLLELIVFWEMVPIAILAISFMRSSELGRVIKALALAVS